VSDRTDGTAAAAVGAHSKDAMETLHGGKLPDQNTPGISGPDRSSGTSDEADDFGASVRSVSDAAMSVASRAGEEPVRATKPVREGISRASGQAYRQGVEAGEYVGSWVKTDPLLTLLGAGALGFVLGLLVGRR
jgi:ElaB/YqjD/DUF883 family membrane-anchored ribosome-binding protein